MKKLKILFNYLAITSFIFFVLINKNLFSNEVNIEIRGIISLTKM